MNTVQIDIFADPRTNEAGVMPESAEGVTILNGPAKRKIEWWGWAIRAAQFPDGAWYVAKSFSCGSHGFSEGLCADGNPFRSRHEAIVYGAKYIINRLEKEKPEPLVAQSINELRKLLEVPA